MRLPDISESTSSIYRVNIELTLIYPVAALWGYFLNTNLVFLVLAYQGSYLASSTPLGGPPRPSSGKKDGLSSTFMFPFLVWWFKMKKHQENAKITGDFQSKVKLVIFWQYDLHPLDQGQEVMWVHFLNSNVKVTYSSISCQSFMVIHPLSNFWWFFCLEIGIFFVLKKEFRSFTETGYIR